MKGPLWLPCNQCNKKTAHDKDAQGHWICRECDAPCGSVSPIPSQEEMARL